MEELADDFPGNPWAARAAADARAESTKIADDQSAQSAYADSVHDAQVAFDTALAAADATRSESQANALRASLQTQSEAAVTKATNQAAADTEAAGDGVRPTAEPESAKPEEAADDATGVSGAGNGVLVAPTIPDPTTCTGYEWGAAYIAADEWSWKNLSGDELTAYRRWLVNLSNVAGAYYRARVAAEEASEAQKRFEREQSLARSGAISASSDDESWRNDPSDWRYRRLLQLEREWAFSGSIPGDSYNNAKKARIRSYCYYLQGSMYGPVYQAPREDAQVVLKGAGMVPGLGIGTLSVDAIIHAYHGEWEQAASSGLGAGLNAWGTFAGGGKAGIVDDALEAADDVATAPANVVDKSWKLKIQGTAQKTGTPGHQFRTYREAIAEAKNPNVRSVHLDHGYNRGLDLDPKTIQPNRRPDVLSVYDNNSVLRVEVQSKTDVPAVLRSRNAALDAQLRAQGFTPTPPRVVRPTTTP